MAFGYGGYLTQSGTDELYAFARTYSPGMARFNENDPVRSFDPMLSMGPHRYVLGYGNPLSYVDPDGRVGFLSDMRQFFDDNSASYRQAGSNPGAGKPAVIANAVGSVLNEVGAAPFRALNYLSNVCADYAGRIAPITFGGVQDQAATDLEGTFHAAEGLANAAAHPLDTRERMSNRFSYALSGENESIFDSAQFVGGLATLPVARAFGPTLGRGLATDVTSQGRNLQALVRELDSQLATGTTVVESAATPMAHGAPLVKICGTGSCFVAGTPVMTIEGLKAIETIQVGELVAARNEFTQISAWQRVETVFITHDREVWNLSFVEADGKIEVITATPNHPFALATGGWREASELMPGDQIATLDGREVRLLTAQILPGSATTYNLKVALDSTYFVGNAGLWVHNQGACCPGANILDNANPVPTKATERVYHHFDENGNVIYIGISDNLNRRAGVHRLDPSKTGHTMRPVTGMLTHDQARTIEGMQLRGRLDEARANGVIDFTESIAEQLSKAGSQNQNRGRDPSRWLKMDPDEFLHPFDETFDIRTPAAK